MKKRRRGSAEERINENGRRVGQQTSVSNMVLSCEQHPSPLTLSRGSNTGSPMPTAHTTPDVLPTTRIFRPSAEDATRPRAKHRDICELNLEEFVDIWPKLDIE